MVCGLVFLVIVFYMTLRSHKGEAPIYPSYVATVKIEVVDEKDIRKTHTLKIIDDGKNAVADLSFSNKAVYMSKDKSIYFADGEYKYIKSAVSYRDLYRTMASLDLGAPVATNGREASYNPKIETSTMDKILDAMNLGSKTSEERNAFVVVKDGFIEEFSLYLTEIENYKSCNIVMTFSSWNGKPVVIPKIEKKSLVLGKKEELFILK